MFRDQWLAATDSAGAANGAEICRVVDEVRRLLTEHTTRLGTSKATVQIQPHLAPVFRQMDWKTRLGFRSEGNRVVAAAKVSYDTLCVEIIRASV